MRPILAAALLAVAGCGSAPQCATGTLLVEVTLAGPALAADTLDVAIVIDGGAAMKTSIAKPAGSAAGSIEVDFPSGYPSNRTVTVTVTARSGAVILAVGSATAAPLAPGCARLDLFVGGPGNADLGIADGAARDAAQPMPDFVGMVVDQSVLPDLTAPIDLAVPPDLRTLPDLTPPGDMANAMGCDDSNNPFTGPPPGKPGGQSVVDSKGNLYILNYDGGGGLLQIPAGGGTSVVVADRNALMINGGLGAPFVEKGDTVLVQGAANIYRYTPNQGVAVWSAMIPMGFYSWDVLGDVNGTILATRSGSVWNSNGTAKSMFAYPSAFMLITATSSYAISGDTVTISCHDGSKSVAWGTGLTDGYGLAIAPDGSLWAGQGNHNPSAIWRVPPGGGAAVSVLTVPEDVTSVVADPTGFIYVAGFSDGNTVWRIDPVKMTKVVYGCDPKSMRKCGDTM
jgi:hypothetical protein